MDVSSAEVVIKKDDKVNGESFLGFLKIIEDNYKNKTKIHLIVDQGPAHTVKIVKDYLKKPECKIELHYLPSYSPNLNPIERLWKIMHEQISNNKFHEKGKDFINAVDNFINTTIHNIKNVIVSRCTDNFQLLY